MFKYPTSVRKHFKKFHGKETPFFCKTCTLVFKSSTAVQNHMENEHGIANIVVVNNVVQNPQVQNVQPQITGPFSEDMSNKEKQYRHNCGWDNQFAFPYEIGMYWNLTTGGLYAVSCIMHPYQPTKKIHI